MGRNAPTEEKRKEDDATLQIILDYVVNNVYPEHACKNQKTNIRKQSKSYFAKSGQLYYRHQRGQHHENSQLFSYVGWGTPIQTLFKAFSYSHVSIKNEKIIITFSQFSEGTGHNSSKNNRNA